MRHKKYENLVVLDFYDEISSDEKSELERHLETCIRCKKFKEKLAQSIPARSRRPAALTEDKMAEARSESHRRLISGGAENRNSQTSLVYSLRPARQFAGLPAYSVAVIALVMLTVGVLSGYLIFGRASRAGNGLDRIVSEISSRNTADIAITDVRFGEADRKTGEIRFSFNITRRFEMAGSLDDRHVQKILAFALVNSDNPGVRLRTIGMLDASVRPDRETEDALIKAVKTDDNAGVRREALISLMKFPFNGAAKEVLLYVLQHDKNPGMRVAAINYLSSKELGKGGSSLEGKAIDPRVLDVLKDRSSSDENRYVRLKASDMLKEFKEL